MPIVTTLHTVLRDPTADHRRVMLGLADLSSQLVVMSQRGRAFLMDIYGVPEQKIDVIAHGIPDMPFVDPNSHKDQFGVEGKNVVLTFGLLSPNKGIEYALHALPEVIREFPNLVYIVLGATHPNLVREQGESYRLSLERLAGDLGIGKHVIFYNRFVERHELIAFIAAADANDSVETVVLDAGGDVARQIAQIEDLIQQAKTTSDVAERTRLYEEAQVIFKEQAPWATIAHSVVFQPVRKEVVDFRIGPFGGNSFYGVDLK